MIDIEELGKSKRVQEALKMWRILSADNFRRYVNEEVHLTIAERRALRIAIENDDSDEAERFRGAT